MRRAARVKIGDPAVHSEPKAGRRSAAWQQVPSGALVAGALGLLVLQYHHGIGLTPDSAILLSAADSLLNGRGLTTSVGTVSRPLTHFPPLYPVLLATGKAITGNFFSAATFLNFASFLCCFLAAYAFVVRQVTRQVALPAVCLLGCSTAAYSVHYTLGTDGLAIPFLITAMCLLGDYERGKRQHALVLAALSLSAASLLRYAYLAFIPAACIVLLLDDEKPFTARLRPAVVLSGIACTPVVAVVVANMIWAGNATNRVLAFHLLGTYSNLRDGADYLSAWFLPYRVPFPERLMAFLAVWVPGLILAVRSPWKYAARITSVFLAFYLIFLIVATSLFDAATPFDERILAPVVAILCLHISLVSAWLWLKMPRWGALAALGAALVILLPALTGASRLAPLITALYKFQDQGSSLAKLTDDYQEVLPSLRELSPESVIYSNVASDIYLVSGRSARDLPVIRGYTDARVRTEGEIAVQVGELWDQVRHSRGLVVYRLRHRTLHDLSLIWWEDLCRRVPLKTMLRSDAFLVLKATGP